MTKYVRRLKGKHRQNTFEQTNYPDKKYRENGNVEK